MQPSPVTISWEEFNTPTAEQQPLRAHSDQLWAQPRLFAAPTEDTWVYVNSCMTGDGSPSPWGLEEGCVPSGDCIPTSQATAFEQLMQMAKDGEYSLRIYHTRHKNHICNCKAFPRL